MDDRGGIRKSFVAGGVGFGEEGVVHHCGLCGGGTGPAVALAFAWGTQRSRLGGGGTGRDWGVGWGGAARGVITGVVAVGAGGGEGLVGDMRWIRDAEFRPDAGCGVGMRDTGKGDAE